MRLATILASLFLLSCQTGELSGPLSVKYSSALTQGDVEGAVVAMLVVSSTETRKTQEGSYERFDTYSFGSDLGGIVMSEYRAGRLAVRNKGWFFQSYEPGRIIAGFQVRSHSMEVAINTERNPIQLELLRSRNLDQHGDRIHENAVVWLEQLEVDVRDALGRAFLMKTARDGGGVSRPRALDREDSDEERI